MNISGINIISLVEKTLNNEVKSNDDGEIHFPKGECFKKAKEIMAELIYREIKN